MRQNPTYRIESKHPLLDHLFYDSARQQVRVVYIASGEVVFETSPAPLN